MKLKARVKLENTLFEQTEMHEGKILAVLEFVINYYLKVYDFHTVSFTYQSDCLVSVVYLTHAMEMIK